MEGSYQTYPNISPQQPINYQPIPPSPHSNPQPPPCLQESDDVIIGIPFKEERQRTHGMIQFINTEVYDESDYGSVYIGALRLNNLIYKWTYLVFGFLFTITVGLLLSFVNGICISLIEWVNQFSFRPALKMVFIVMQPVRGTIQIVAQAIAPVFELIFPGTFKNWKMNKNA